MGKQPLDKKTEDYIVELYEGGTSFGSIGAILNRDGVPTPQGESRWSPSTISAVIERASQDRNIAIRGVNDPLNWSWQTIVRAVAVLAAVLLLYGPSAHYVEVYASPPTLGGVVGYAQASATVGCMSQLARWEERPSHVQTLVTSSTPEGRHPGLPGFQNDLRAGDACEGAINGRDHLVLALVIGAVILGAVTFVKRRDPSARPSPSAPLRTNERLAGTKSALAQITDHEPRRCPTKWCGDRMLRDGYRSADHIGESERNRPSHGRDVRRRRSMFVRLDDVTGN